MDTFKKFKGKNNEYYFNVVARNGEVILSSEGYKSKRNRNIGINSVIENAQDPENFSRLESKDDQFYFNLLAANGEIIGTSEMYSTVGAMEIGIKSVIHNTKR